MTGYSDLAIAIVCHAANAALMEVNGDDHASPPWAEIPEWWRNSAVADVRTARAGTTPQEMHAEWCTRKRAAGWVWGAVRDETAKTHPSLVDDYAKVPWPERAKDRLYLAIIGALAADDLDPDNT